MRVRLPIGVAVKWGYRSGCAAEHSVKVAERYPESPLQRYFKEAEIRRTLVYLGQRSDQRE